MIADDFDDLDPDLFCLRHAKYGYTGSSSQSQVRDDVADRAFDEAHRFYNYQVRKWIDDVVKK